MVIIGARNVSLASAEDMVESPLNLTQRTPAITALQTRDGAGVGIQIQVLKAPRWDNRPGLAPQVSALPSGPFPNPLYQGAANATDLPYRLEIFPAHSLDLDNPRATFEFTTDQFGSARLFIPTDVFPEIRPANTDAEFTWNLYRMRIAGCTSGLHAGDEVCGDSWYSEITRELIQQGRHSLADNLEDGAQAGGRCQGNDSREDCADGAQRNGRDDPSTPFLLQKTGSGPVRGSTGGDGFVATIRFPDASVYADVGGGVVIPTRTPAGTIQRGHADPFAFDVAMQAFGDYDLDDGLPDYAPVEGPANLTFYPLRFGAQGYDMNDPYQIPFYLNNFTTTLQLDSRDMPATANGVPLASYLVSLKWCNPEDPSDCRESFHSSVANQLIDRGLGVPMADYLEDFSSDILANPLHLTRPDLPGATNIPQPSGGGFGGKPYGFAVEASDFPGGPQNGHTVVITLHDAQAEFDSNGRLATGDLTVYASLGHGPQIKDDADGEGYCFLSSSDLASTEHAGRANAATNSLRLTFHASDCTTTQWGDTGWAHVEFYNSTGLLFTATSPIARYYSSCTSSDCVNDYVADPTESIPDEPDLRDHCRAYLATGSYFADLSNPLASPDPHNDGQYSWFWLADMICDEL